jgi:hypothetical protein
MSTRAEKLATANRALDEANQAVRAAYETPDSTGWPAIASALRARSSAWWLLAELLDGEADRHLGHAVMLAAHRDSDAAKNYGRWADRAPHINRD